MGRSILVFAQLPCLLGLSHQGFPSVATGSETSGSTFCGFAFSNAAEASPLAACCPSRQSMRALWAHVSLRLSGTREETADAESRPVELSLYPLGLVSARWRVLPVDTPRGSHRGHSSLEAENLPSVGAPPAEENKRLAFRFFH